MKTLENKDKKIKDLFSFAQIIVTALLTVILTKMFL